MVEKLLMDENHSRLLAKKYSLLITVESVHDLGWEGKKNGELLRAMNDEGFEALTTAD